MEGTETQSSDEIDNTINPVTITMEIDRCVYKLMESQEPNLIFTVTSHIDQPITIHVKNSILDPNTANIWKQHAQNQPLAARDTSTNRRIYFPAEIRCGPSYIRQEHFRTIHPDTPLVVSLPLRRLSNWTRRDVGAPSSFVNRHGEQVDRYFRPGHEYAIRLRCQPQISLRWWYGVQEELLRDIGTFSKLRDLPASERPIQIVDVPEVTVMIE